MYLSVVAGDCILPALCVVSKGVNNLLCLTVGLCCGQEDTQQVAVTDQRGFSRKENLSWTKDDFYAVDTVSNWQSIAFQLFLSYICDV